MLCCARIRARRALRRFHTTAQRQFVAHETSSLTRACPSFSFTITCVIVLRTGRLIAPLRHPWTECMLRWLCVRAGVFASSFTLDDSAHMTPLRSFPVQMRASAGYRWGFPPTGVTSARHRQSTTPSSVSQPRAPWHSTICSEQRFHKL